MPRRHDDYEPTPRKKSNTGMVLALVLGGVALVGLVVVGGCFALFFSAKKGIEQQPAKEEAAIKSLPTRDEFRSKVMGKTPDEVLAAIGKPVRTTEGTAKGEADWYYENCSRDPINGKTDSWVQVIFEEGRVVRINF